VKFIRQSIWALFGQSGGTDARLECSSGSNRLIFGTSTQRRNLRGVDDQRHRRRIECVVDRFATAYPEIAYDVLWSSRTCNAQAFVWDDVRRVRLYGGLARHAKISIAAIAWVLAHETGHHLGGFPFDPHFPWISSEDRADEWANTIGLKAVFGKRLALRYAGFGRREASRLVCGKSAAKVV